jgi:hypothetical protein
MRGRTPYLVPCTPLGCMELLKRSQISVRGKSAVVVGDRCVFLTELIFIHSVRLSCTIL